LGAARHCDLPRQLQGTFVQHIVVLVVVAVTYGVLALVSAAVAYAPTDAWTVWLASGGEPR